MAPEGETRDLSDDALEQRVADLEAETESLHDQLADRDRYIEELEDLVQELKARLKRYENANTPSSRRGGAAPASDPSDNDDTDDGEDSDADSESSPGRNSGHEGTTRPPPDPDRTVRVEEACCPDCGRVLTDPDEYDSCVVIDIPLPVPIEAVEYELGKHECCGNDIVAEHPECPQNGRFGPRLLAQTTLLRYQGRLPHRKQAELFDWQLDHPVSSGTIYNMTKRVADRLRSAYEEVRANVRESDVVYCDETGFPVDGDQHWVWTFVTDEDVFYTIDESRGSQVLEDVLGDELAEDTTLSCDGWSAYPTYHTNLQRCWAHLLREAKYVAERHEEAEPVSEVLHDLHEDLTAFDERDPPASARERRRAQASLCLEELIRADYETEEVTDLVEKIRNGLGCWLTFVTEPDVDSTNNRAERALREQVVMRKIFGGLRSETGVRIHEILSTMVATWNRQGLDPPDELTSVLGGEQAETSMTELR